MTRAMQRWPVCAFWLALWSPGLAYACPVCFSAKDEANRLAFLGTTVFLTALPLILIGLFISWIARRTRELDAEKPYSERR